MAIEFRLLSNTGAETVVLPDVESFSLSPVMCDAGAIEFSYPKNGTNWASIKDLDEFSLAVYIDGVRQSRLDAVIKDVDGDDVDDSAVWKFTGYFGNGRLQEAITYPKGWPSAVNPTLPNQTFATATAGTIVGTLMQQAQTRGTLSGITYNSFSSTTDSNGVAWTKTISIEYAPQVDYLELIQNLYVQQLCEFEMVGSDLRLYVPGTMSVDRTTGSTPLVFRKGRDLSDSPRKRSTRDLGTVVLAAGNEGLYLERANASAVAARRRIEAKASSGNVSDSGTLTAFADAEVARVSAPRMEKTHGLVFGDATSPRPIRDFNVGDWAYSDMGNGLERLRIKQWVLSYSADGQLKGSVTLNDFFAEQEEYLSRRIDGIVGGSTITGGSRAVDTVPTEVVDNMAPAVPTGLGLTSLAYVDIKSGQTFAQVTASWLQTTTNADGTILSDLAGYRLRWRYASMDANAWNYVDPGPNTTASWSPVTPGVNIYAQIQAYDKVGNASGWSTQVGPFTTGADATPPETPSTPLVDNYLGLIRYRWDGKTASGAAIAVDQNVVEVHSSATSNFTPDLTANSTTRIDSLSTAGVGFYKSTTYGETRYFKLVAVDHSNNYSTPSAQASGTSSAILGPDVFDGAVGSSKLADLAVITAKIADLAVNDAKIGSVSVGKLTAGVINAEVTISGRIATALTGKRVEMNSIGFQGWDTANNQTISLDGVNNLLVGRYRSAVSGRRLEMGSSGVLGEIDFYAPDATLAYVRAYTESAGVESIQMGVPKTGVASALWNKVHVNSDEWTNIQANRISFMYGATTGTRSGLLNIFQTPDKGVTTTARLAMDLDSFHLYDDTGIERFMHDGNGMVFKNWSDGAFTIFERGRSSFVEAAKFTINNTAIDFYIGNTQEFRIFDRLNGGGISNRFKITDTDLWWQWNDGTSTYNARMLFRPASVLSGGQTTPGIQLVNNSNFGVLLRGYVDAGGGNPRLEVRSVSDTTFVQVYASGFPVQSSRTVKTEIEDIGFSAIEKLRPLRAKSFVRKETQVPEIGFEAEDLPDEMRIDSENGPFWDLAPSLAVTIAALVEIDQRVAKLELLAPGGGKVIKS